MSLKFFLLIQHSLPLNGLLQLQSDYAYTLKSENELLNQDIQTLEEELTKSKEERDLVRIEHKSVCHHLKSLL